ncbi:hypothetical protein [Enterococcus sp. LJL51]|uniref:hypothetical protein n=1 Tax=Enterococcus sp. LJL51 TaxID=3416656 RepID=UPI003CF61206
MTVPEYELRMKAYQLQMLDRQYEIHMQAWANVMAGQTKKGRPVFRTFEKFFNYRKAEQKILGKKQKQPSDTKNLQNWIANFNS